MDVAREMNFPWLMSNVKDKSTGELLAKGKESFITEWQGKKVRHTITIV